MGIDFNQLRFYLVKDVLFSITVTLAPNNWASIAVLKPIGPAPTTTMRVFEAAMFSEKIGFFALSSSNLNRFEHLMDLTFSYNVK